MKVDVKSRRTRTTDSSAASTMSAGKKFLLGVAVILLIIAIVASLFRETTAEPVVEGVLTTEEFITQYGGEFVAEYKQLSQDYLTHLRQEADERNLDDDDIDWDRLEHDLTPNKEEALDLARKLYSTQDYKWRDKIIEYYEKERATSSQRNFLLRDLVKGRCEDGDCDGMVLALKAFAKSSKSLLRSRMTAIWAICELLQELLDAGCCRTDVDRIRKDLSCGTDYFSEYQYGGI